MAIEINATIGRLCSVEEFHHVSIDFSTSWELCLDMYKQCASRWQIHRLRYSLYRDPGGPTLKDMILHGMDDAFVIPKRRRRRKGDKDTNRDFIDLVLGPLLFSGGDNPHIPVADDADSDQSAGSDVENDGFFRRPS